MKRIGMFAVLGVVVVAGVFAMLSAIFSATTHNVGRVSRGPALETVYATGLVEARERRVLKAPRAGVVGRIYSRTDGKTLHEGDEVAQGQPIIQLRDSAREARRTSAKAELDRVTEQLATGSAFRNAFEMRIAEAAQSALDESKRLERLEQQGVGRGVTEDAIAAARTRAITANERLKTLQQDRDVALANLEAAHKTAQASLDLVAAQERDDTIAAPMDGVLLRLPLKEGEFAASGAELAMVGDIRELIIEADVNEDDIGRVRLSAQVKLRLAGNDRSPVDGRVYEILPDADRATKGYRVKVSFEAATFVTATGSKLRGSTRLPGDIQAYSGMTAELAVIVSMKDGALVFPRSALSGDNTVYVLKDGRVAQTKVVLGLVNFSTCEAVSGLSEGDLVVTSDVRSLKDGARVKAKESP